MPSATINGVSYNVQPAKLKHQALIDAFLATLPEPPFAPSRARAEAMRAAIVEAGEAAIRSFTSLGAPGMAEAAEASLRQGLLRAAAEQMAISLDRIPEWPPKLATGGHNYLTEREDGQKLLLKCALGLTDERIDALYDDLDMEDFYEVIGLFLGGKKKAKPADEEEGGAPKGGGSPGASSTGTT